MSQSSAHHYSSSSDCSSRNFSSSRRRLPPAPSEGILRNRNRHVTIADPDLLSRRVYRIADNLDDAARNLSGVDSKLSQYRDVQDDSMAALTKLQEDLEGSIGRLRSSRKKRTLLNGTETLRKSELRSASVAPRSRNYDNDDFSGRSTKRPSSSLGFNRHGGSGDNYSSAMRDTVSDLSASQARLEQDLNDEISHRIRAESGTRRAINDLNDSIRRPPDRVQQRLKEIEKGLSKDRNLESQIASRVADSVLRKSQTRQADDDFGARSRLLEMENSRRNVENELDATRRRLEQSEGGREALVSQINELRSLITQSDKERSNLKLDIERQAMEQKSKMQKEFEMKEKLAVLERQECERARQANEIEELRAAIKRSGGVVQLDEVRRNLEKSERQRQHLSDHIEVLTKDLEKKDLALSRTLNELNETQRKYVECERSNDYNYRQLEDTISKFKDQVKETEKLENDYQKMVERKMTAEKENDELKNNAQDTIRHWKQKCRKLEKDVERMTEKVHQVNSKNEDLAKQIVVSKTQANNAFQQVENLRIEIENNVGKRAEMTEKMHKYDVEITSLGDEKMLLTKNLSESNQNIKQCEDRIRDLLNKVTATNCDLEKCHRENDSLRSMCDFTKNQIENVHSEVSESKRENSRLQSELAGEKMKLTEALKHLESNNKQMEAMKLEVSSVHKQLNIERSTHNSELQKLNSDIHSGEVEKIQAVQDVSKKANNERCLLESEIHKINMEMNEEKSLHREAQTMLKKAKDGLNLRSVDLKRLEIENHVLKEKYQLLNATYEKNCKELGHCNCKVEQLDVNLLWSRDKVRKLEQCVEVANAGISQDVNELQALLGLTASERANKSYSSEGNDDIHAWILKLRKKLDSIKFEVQAKLDHRSKLMDELDKQKEEMKSCYTSLKGDQDQLICEVTEQNKLINSLSKEKASLLLENKEARIIVHDLEDKVTNLTCSLQQESQKEREKIQQRYMKYKDTINSLQADLEVRGKNDASRTRTNFKSYSRTPSPHKRT